MRYFALLVLAATVTAAWRQRRAASPGRTKRSLWTILAGALVLFSLHLELAVAGRTLATAILLAQVVVSLVMAWALATLALVDWGERRWDRLVRLPALALALLLAVFFGLGPATPFVVVAGLAFRWHRHLGTRGRFLAALGAGATFVLSLGWVQVGQVPPAITALGSVTRLVRDAALVSGLVGCFQTLGAVPQDSTLGIRSVGRRLGLSHALVAVVPLLLIGALWVWTTWLGVGADRAVVAKRALEAQHTAMSARLAVAMTSADENLALTRLARSPSDEEQGLRVYLRDRGDLRRVAGDSLQLEPLLDSFFAAARSLPPGPILRLPDAAFLWGWAWSDDSTRAALAVIPLESALAGLPARLTGGRLVTTRARPTASDFVADSLLEAASRRAGSGVNVDSLQRVLALASLRSMGLAESVLSADTVAGGAVWLRVNNQRVARLEGSMPGDSLTSPGGARGALSTIGFTGQLAPEGIAFEGGRWQSANTLVRVITPLPDALLGFYRHARENPIGVLPLLILGLLVAMSLPVLLFDLALVRGLQRSITEGIAGLRGGFYAIGQGRLEHRVSASNRPDELAEAARAFNKMAADLEHARELQKERDRFESELELARRIQARLLPTGPPHVPGWDIAGRSESAREVGGDYYDHLALPDGRHLLVIADVSGKGVPAALLMSAFRASLMSQDLSAADPAPLAARLNEFLHASVESGKFVTAFLALLDPVTGRIDYTNAGHNPPCVVRGGGGSEWLEVGGLILGILPGSRFEAGHVTLAEQDLLAMYTDGVTEGADASGEQWGEERLLASLLRGSRDTSAALAERVTREVRAFEGESGPADDLTVLLARRLPEA